LGLGDLQLLLLLWDKVVTLFVSLLRVGSSDSSFTVFIRKNGLLTNFCSSLGHNLNPGEILANSRESDLLVTWSWLGRVG